MADKKSQEISLSLKELGMSNFNELKLPSNWDTTPKLLMSIGKKNQSTTSCVFSCITVTVMPYKNSHTTLSSSRDLLGGRRRNRNNNNDVSLAHPKFMSPLMSGHVSGLKSTKSSNLAQLRKNHFFHNALISERDVESKTSNQRIQGSYYHTKKLENIFSFNGKKINNN